jgi:acetyl esterase
MSIPGMPVIADTIARRHRSPHPWGPSGGGIAGIAPALVITCEIDRLHDEDVAYAGI